jgi:hypothetical protein
MEKFKKQASLPYQTTRLDGKKIDLLIHPASSKQLIESTAPDRSLMFQKPVNELSTGNIP